MNALAILFRAATLAPLLLAGCGDGLGRIEECKRFPLKGTVELIAVPAFKPLAYSKVVSYDAVRGGSQLLITDSKFQYSKSFVLDFVHASGTQNAEQHSRGCLGATSLSIKAPPDSEGRNLVMEYLAFFRGKGFSAQLIQEIATAMETGSDYRRLAEIEQAAIFAGTVTHPSRGAYFKLDVRPASHNLTR